MENQIKKEVSKIKIENYKISVNFTKEDVYNFLKTKLELEQKILDKMKDEEIDGDALILLIKNEYKFSDLKVKIRSQISGYLEEDIFKFQDNIKDNEIFKEIYIEELDKLWKSEKFKQLKLGNKLKYIKYLILKGPPLEIEKKDELDNYLKKIINNENIKDIQEMFNDLLDYDENNLNKQFEEWELNIDNIFQLKIIIKIIKQKINKTQQKEEIKNDNKKNKSNNIINN